MLVKEKGTRFITWLSLCVAVRHIYNSRINILRICVVATVANFLAQGINQHTMPYFNPLASPCLPASNKISFNLVH